MPVAERAEARRTYWKARWGEVDGACEWPCLDLLESLARQQAQELKPISTAQIVETLRYTANKKGGPDCGVLASSALAKAWEQSWTELLGVSHRWKIVKGPLAATQAVLMDVGWTACQRDSWMDDLGFACHIDASDPC